MTLTGKLDAARREPVTAMLKSQFSDIGLRKLAIDRVALFRQDGPHSRFRIIRDYVFEHIPD
jgi:hypothetical protein